MQTLHEVEAVVEVDGEEIRYRRAGQGSPVLLLRSGARVGSGTGEVDALFRELASGRRVIEPLTPLPTRRGAADRWLRGLIEGLGLTAPEVMAEPALAPLLTRFVGRNGGAVGRVVFLRMEEAGASRGEE